MAKRKHPLDFPGSQAAVTTRHLNDSWPKGSIVDVCEFIPGAHAERTVWNTARCHSAWFTGASTELRPIGPVARALLRLK